MVDQSLMQFRRALIALRAAGELPPHVEISAVTTATRLRDLGLDSLGSLGLISTLEEAADIHLPEASLVGLELVADLLRVVLAEQQKR
jgi:acyl carrier protein